MQDREYELQANGREPRIYTDAAQAGAAFFAAKREEQPKVLLHEGDVTVSIALTTRDPRDPSGYGHLLLAPPDDFKAGYDQAKAQMPGRAVGVEDVPPSQHNISPERATEILAEDAAWARQAAAPAAQAKPVAPEVINTIELAVPRAPEPEKPIPAAAPTPPQKPDREQLLKSLEERFEVTSVGTLRKPIDEYRIGGDKGQLRVAFTDHGKRLESRYDAPEVVRGMVDLAQAKGWREIQVAGTLEFQRATWMEGNLRGIHVAGYTPSRQDEDRLKAAREQLAQQRQPAQQPAAPEKPANTVEPAKAPQPAKQPEQTAAPAAGGSTTTREQFLNMARSVMKDQGYGKDEIDKTIKVMGQKVDAMLARGEQLPKIQVYDKAAPSRAPAPTVVQQPTPQQTPQHGRGQEPAHAP